MNQFCTECFESFRAWGGDPRNDGSCNISWCGNFAGIKEREIERWGEYIVNGNPPAHLPVPSQEVQRAINVKDHKEVIELERKVSGLNKALANHLAVKTKKRIKYTFDR